MSLMIPGSYISKCWDSLIPEAKSPLPYVPRVSIRVTGTIQTWVHRQGRQDPENIQCSSCFLAFVTTERKIDNGILKRSLVEFGKMDEH